MRVDTAANIVNAVLLEQALADSAVSNVYASTDTVVVQLRALLSALGQDLAALRPWSHLQLEHAFNTAAGVESYALPAGYVGMLPQTGWNRSTDVEFTGPASPQAWQVAASTETLTSTGYLFRVKGNRLFLEPTPAAVESLVFEYVSAYWVVPSGQTAPTLEAPTTNTDALWFDKRLLVTGLTLRWLEAKGFDTTAAQRAYDAALASAMGNDGAHPVLDLSPLPCRSGPALPDTNWGV
jgi:hypothetical protein